MNLLKSLIKQSFIPKESILIALFLVFGFNSTFAQYNIPDKPKYIPPVIDSTSTLSSTEYKALYNKLKNYNDSTSTEILVVIIPTTKGENIGLLAPRWGQKWEIGQAKEDNGVLILLAKNDRKIWIAPGYGIEQSLTAGINGEIIRNIIIPEFKQGDYYSGLDKGINAIFEVIAGEYKGKPKPNKDNQGFPFGILFMLLIIFLFIIIAISKNKRGGGRGGNRGNRLDSRDLLEAIILSNLGRGSFGRGSSGWGGSSGGFGGGGGFSGGGAGGSW